jgi:hypothetical protein
MSNFFQCSVTIRGCLSFNGIETLTDVKGNINSQIYIDVLENNLWPVIAQYANQQSSCVFSYTMPPCFYG